MFVPLSVRPIFEALCVADRSQGGVEGLSSLIGGNEPWAEGLAACVEYVCAQRWAEAEENDRLRAALTEIRDQDRIENVLDPQWSARIAAAALNPTEAEEA